MRASLGAAALYIDSMMIGYVECQLRLRGPFRRASIGALYPRREVTYDFSVRLMGQ